MIKITFEFDNVVQAKNFLDHTGAHLSQPEGVVTEAEPATAGEKVDKPKAGRRGRPAKEDSPKTPRRRAGRPAKVADEDTAPPADASISDAEVSKAASEAAKDLTVQKVLDELKEYKVTKVSELDQPQRKGFLARLRELLNGSADSDNPAFQ